MLILKIFLFIDIVAGQFEKQENSNTVIKCARSQETEEVVSDSDGEAPQVFFSATAIFFRHGEFPLRRFFPPQRFFSAMAIFRNGYPTEFFGPPNYYYPLPDKT